MPITQADVYNANAIDFSVTFNTDTFRSGIQDIRGLKYSIDYPDLNIYRDSTVTIVMIDPNATFDQLSRGTSVLVDVSVDTSSQRLFSGTVKETVHIAKIGRTHIIAVGQIRALRTDVQNFGVQRHFRLQASGSGFNGNYPFLPALGDPSEESITVHKSLTETATQVDNIERFGDLDSDNYEVESNKIVSEGGEIFVADPTTFPQAAFKSPFRWRFATELADEILNAFPNIISRDIDLVPTDLGSHFSTNGRVGYDLIATPGGGQDVSASWEGYVTDWLYDPTDEKYYFLYNPGENNGIYRPRIMSFSVSTHSYSEVATSTDSQREFWAMVKNGTQFAVLTTTQADYDAQATGTIAIHVFDTVSSAWTTPITSASAFRPQLGHYYHFGSAIEFQAPDVNDYILPDSRRPIYWRSDGIYYPFSNDDAFGIAKQSGTVGDPAEQIVSVTRDAQQNHVGFTYNITGDTLYGAVTWRDSVNSQMQTFQRAL